jgi:hypothetical protein
MTTTTATTTRTPEQVQAMQSVIQTNWKHRVIELEGPLVIRALLPNGYLIVADETDRRYYPQRESPTGGSHALVTESVICPGSYTPISFPESELGRAMALCDLDSRSPRPLTWGCIVYTQAELDTLSAPEEPTQAQATTTP